MRRLLSVLVLVAVGCESEPAEPEFVPQWAKSAVWYQIFPERFRNGDPTNDPTLETLVGADPQEMPASWHLHPWGADWYKLQPWELENGEPELWKHLLRRRYGGDLQGIIDKLPYLDSLGVNALYLNPVFEAPSLHKYDAKTYHHIDPNFGPDPEGDRAMIAGENPLDPATWVWTSADELALDLIRKAHARGMRIIFDGVFNHMGIMNFAFQDVLVNQAASPFADWFIVHSWRDEAVGTEFEYQGWVGVPSLPAFVEDEQGIVEGPKAYIFAAVERWMNPRDEGIKDGIDGWRLDVAWDVSHAFWEQFRTHVKTINPAAYLTAELVLPYEEVLPYLEGDEFDGEMNYNFAFAAAEFLFNPGPHRITATEFGDRLDQLREGYPDGVAYVSQNLFGSHDSNRLGSHIRNRGIGNFRDWGTYFNLSKPSDNPDYDVSKPTEEDLQLQKLFVVLQMTAVGAPMVYYGDEVGMWGGNDPDDRKPMIWPDLVYEAEVTKPDQSLRAPDAVAQNLDLLSFYRHVIAIRTAHPALQTGSYRRLLADDGARVFAFERAEGNDRLAVVLNAGDASAEVSLDGYACADELVTGDRFDGVVPAVSGRVLRPCE